MRSRKISFSQYSMWKACPHQWKLNYHDGLKIQSDSIHTIFGTAIHHAIQEWLVYLYGSDLPEPNVHALFKDKLRALFIEKTIVGENNVKTFLCDKPTYIEFVHQGISILDYILKNHRQFFPTKQWELLGCEIPLDINITDEVYFVGFLDIVLVNALTGEVRILDLKTSTKGWRYEKSDDKKLYQLLLYKHYYAKQFEVDPALISVTFVVVARTGTGPIVENFDPPQTSRNVKKAVDALNTFVTTAFDAAGAVVVEKLGPTPSTHTCRFCPFSRNKDLCKVGIPWVENY